MEAEIASKYRRSPFPALGPVLAAKFMAAFTVPLLR